MIEIGTINALEVARETTVGLFLTDGEGHDVLLPWKYVPGKCPVGSMLDVFIYLDGEERLVATSLEPKIKLHEFALLTVAAITTHGAFMDWGLENDLFVPWAEQGIKLSRGQEAIVFLYIDERSGRLTGSTKVGKYLSNANLNLKEGEQVEVMVYEETQLGWNVIVNQKLKGLAYKNETAKPIKIGDTMEAWVKTIREDNKIDILLQAPGYAHVDAEVQRLLEALEKNNGYLPLNDESDPELIRSLLGMSKKTFKKAVGYLLRRKRISIEEEGIRVTTL